MRTSFSDGVITIRPFGPDDVSSFFAVVRASAEVLGRWMPWCHADYSMDEAKAWLATCQKVGAKFECIARNRLVGWGKSHDAAVFAYSSRCG